MKTLKGYNKYQISTEDGMLNTVYDKQYEAKRAGDNMIDMGYIAGYIIIAVKAAWLRVK
jgi:hypothetical protein